MLLKAHTCFSLWFMLAKLDLGVSASTFFNRISDMFFLSLGVMQRVYVLSGLVIAAGSKFKTWLLFSPSAFRYLVLLAITADLFSLNGLVA